MGASGRAAMPATLPPSSAYTYAVELSVDEAVMAGAREVTFSRPVPVYLENFLGMPVGAQVPAGAYDRERANVVRRVRPDGTIEPFAGGLGGSGGDGGRALAARLSGPQGLSVAPDGSVYIADRMNGRIRRVSPAGIIETVAGKGNAYGTWFASRTRRARRAASSTT